MTKFEKLITVLAEQVASRLDPDYEFSNEFYGLLNDCSEELDKEREEAK